MASSPAIPKSFVEDAAPGVPKSFIEDAPSPQPQRLSGSLPHPDLVDQQTTAAARLLAERMTRPADSMDATISAAPAPTLWQKLTAPFVGGMTGDIRAQDTPISRAFGGEQEPPAVSNTRDNLLSFENAATDQGPGVVRGALKTASGLTSPLNISMLAGMLPAGVAGKLLSLGFSAQMLVGAANQVPEFVDAVKKKDWPRARELGTTTVLQSLMAALAVKHGGSSDGPAAPEVTDTMRREATTPFKEPGAPYPAAPALSRDQRRATAVPPASGVSEDVARGVDARERFAQQLAGRPFAQLKAGDQNAIDELIAEQNRGQGGREQKPVPASFIEDKPKEKTNEKAQIAGPQRQPVTSTGAVEQRPAAGPADAAAGPPAPAGTAAADEVQAPVLAPDTSTARHESWDPNYKEIVAKRQAEATRKALEGTVADQVERARESGEIYGGGNGGADSTRSADEWFSRHISGADTRLGNSVWAQYTPEQQARVKDAFMQAFSKPASGSPGEPAAAEVRAPAAEAPPAPYLPGKHYDIPPSEFKLDPVRFQFKQEGIGQKGVSDQFKNVKKWDPDLAGTVHAWLDPADGQVYPVNGHHRVEMGQRFGDDNVPEGIHTRMIDARNATEARAKGALINIAEGNGTALDVAKFLRDSGLTRAQVEQEGKVVFVKKSAQQGAALANLSQPIFDDVVAGALPVERAAVIGEGLSSHADQKVLYDVIKKRQARGLRPTNDQIEEMIRLANGGQKIVKKGDGQANLFGDTEDVEQSLLGEKAEISDYVRKQLTAEKKLFGIVGSQGAAEKLAAAGNVIKAGENAQIADRTNEGLLIYDKLSGSAGPVDQALERAAIELANGEDANAVKQRAYQEIRAHVLAQADQLAGVPPGSVRGDAGDGGDGRPQADRAPVQQAAQEIGQQSLVSSEQEQQSQSDTRSSADKLLGEQLTAQIASGGPARDPHLKPAENRGLFDEPQPETESLFGLFDDKPAEERPPARGNPRRGGISAELLTLGADKFFKDDVAPAVKEAAATIVESADDILKVLAPQLRSEAAQKGGLILRHKLGELARRYDQAEAALRTARRAFNRMPSAENYEFIRRVEANEKQKAPEFDQIAGVLRQLLDGRRQDVQDLGAGKLQKFYENYFPHIWEKPGKAEKVFAQFFGRRPLEGGKSFLKQRTLPTFADGLAAGLKPVSDNPVDLVMLKVREMDRYIMAHRVLNDWKEEGLAKFVDARKGKAPAGWTKIADPIGTVYGQSVQQIAEYPNAGLYEPLQQLAKDLGIRHERGFEMGGPALGYAQQGGGIKTRHGTAEDTLAHEIGHQLDWKYGLADQFVDFPGGQGAARIKAAYRTLRDKASTPDARKAARQDLAGLKEQIAKRAAVKQELRDLADLRDGPQDYVRSKEEKMAAIVQAWVGAKEQFQRVAPTVYGEWTRFLDRHAELKPLRDIEGGMTKTQIAQPYDVGGLVIRGNWFAPEGAARVLNNHLAPGLRAKSGAYRVALGVNNVLNQAQLGLSAFHLGFTSADAAVSKGALGIEQLLRGKPLAAAKSLAEVPIAPVTNILKGNKVLREWYKPGSQGEAMAAIVDGLEKAGGRVRMDEFYQTRIAEKMGQAFRNGNLLGGILRAPFAGVEGVSNVIMKHVVPRQKLGVFADLAAHEMERLGPGASAEQVRASMAKVWDSVENRMGQMTYDNLFWDRNAKDIAMLATRSVGWNLGTIREIGGAAVDVARLPVQMARGKKFEDVNLHRLAYVTSLAITSAAMGAIYQYLATGKGPQELKDYYFPRNGQLDEAGRPQRVALPTYVKDVYHYATEPGKTLANKVAPVWSLFGEMIHNRDFYGTEIRNADDPLIRQMLDTAEHGARAFEPFGFRNLERANKLQAPLAQKAQNFVGITPAPAALEKTRAELLASELAHDSIPAGGRTREAAAKRDAEQNISRLARMGKPVTAAVEQDLKAGTLTMADVRRALAGAHMDPLQRSFHGLGLDNALQVWKTATPAERQRLRPLLIQKGKTLAAKSPAERAALVPRFNEALRVR